MTMTSAPASRDAILKLGASPHGSWGFLPRAVALLDEGDRDPEILALVAAHAIRLGLKSLASDAIGALPSEYSSDPQVQALRDAASRVKPDVLSPERRVAITRENAAALGPAGHALLASFESWSRHAADSVACVANDRNVTLRTDPARPFRYSILGDAAAHARSAWQPRVKPSEDPTGEPPVLLAGLITTGLLERIFDATPAGATGYSPRVWLYEPDAFRALDALSFHPMREVLGSPRLLAFLGENARERLRSGLYSAAGEHLPHEIVSEPDGLLDAAAILHDAAKHQHALHTSLTQRIAERTRVRSDAWWADRLENKVGDAPTRILLATTRYSTVTCAMAHDLADAFRSAGCESDVLIEPDTHSRMSSIAYLDRIERFDPDLIVVVNYPRATLASAIPEGIPYVTWVQDAMPHLFDPSLASKATPRDFAIGVLSARLVETMGLRRDTSRRFPVVANARKFHTGSVTNSDDVACEIAYVGHQSDSAESVRDRFKAGLARSGQSTVFVDPLFEAVREVLADTRARWGWEFRDIVPEILARYTSREPTQVEVERVIAAFVVPLADRLVRHETLGWAASICERRGWRLRIYGDGWERHPAFSRYAHRRLEHGEPLRGVYQRAVVNLHASVTTLCHQRVFECALSGGLPLCRYLGDAIEASFLGALGAAAERRHPDGLPEGQLPALRVADHPELRRYNETTATLGRETSPEYTVSPFYDTLLRTGQIPAFEHTALRVFPHPHDVFFDSEAALETRVLRASENPDWRASTSRALAEHVKAHCSHDALAKSMLELAHSALRRSGSPGSRG